MWVKNIVCGTSADSGAAAKPNTAKNAAGASEAARGRRRRVPAQTDTARMPNSTAAPMCAVNSVLAAAAWMPTDSFWKNPSRP